MYPAESVFWSSFSHCTPLNPKGVDLIIKPLADNIFVLDEFLVLPFIFFLDLGLLPL